MMMPRYLLSVFLVKTVDGFQKLIGIPIAQHFSDRHQLPFAGAVRPDVAREFDLRSQISIEGHRLEPGFRHRNQRPGYSQQFMCLAFALAFTDFKRVVFFHVRCPQKGVT